MLPRNSIAFEQTFNTTGGKVTIQANEYEWCVVMPDGTCKYGIAPSKGAADQFDKAVEFMESVYKLA